jgi:hypothetical protein
VGGWGVYYTRPSLPILITYKQEGVGIPVKLFSYPSSVKQKKTELSATSGA